MPRTRNDQMMEESVAARMATPNFFSRNGLTARDVERCLAVVREHFPDYSIAPIAAQGACSCTIAVCDNNSKNKDGRIHGTTTVNPKEQKATIVQFRLSRHAIPWDLAVDARSIFGSLVPNPLWSRAVAMTNDTVLQVCAMTAVPGVAFLDLCASGGNGNGGDGELDDRAAAKLHGLLLGLAAFFASAWATRAADHAVVPRQGKVASSIELRLRRLEHELPSAQMRRRASRVRQQVEFGALDVLPVVLNHGDLLPGNIMVDEDSWELRGLVDWAEAEYLPFGMTLYGIEHLLGSLATDGRWSPRCEFVYYRQANQLRAQFWQRLVELVPSLVRKDLWSATLLAREVGVLLWHGIAWDDGKLDRVVNPENDQEELAYLEAFLQAVPSRRNEISNL